MKKVSRSEAVRLCPACQTGYILPADLHPHCEARLCAKHAGLALCRLPVSPVYACLQRSSRSERMPSRRSERREAVTGAGLTEMDKLMFGSNFPDVLAGDPDGGRESEGSSPSILGSPISSPASPLGGLESDYEGGAPPSVSCQRTFANT